LRSTRRTILATLAALPALSEDRREAIRRSGAALAGYPGQQLPKADLEQADKIAAGVVFFQRRIPVEVGLRGIDWSGGHVHHRSWPEQLNRFFHLGPLAAAYAATRNERYAEAARAYIEDWMRGDPYPGANKRRAGDSALTMSIRLGTSEHAGWTGHLPVFLASPAFDDTFLDRMLASLSGQAQYAASHLAVGPNWYISQLDALVFLSLRLPFLKNADTLRQTGIDRLRHELTAQFTNDGAHIERTPSYHHWMTSVAMTYVDLARRFPQVDARVDPRRVARSLDYTVQSEMCGFNDSDPAPNGASAKYLAERRDSLARLGLADRSPSSPPLDQVFPDAGQVFSRTAWDRNADSLAFDAARWGGTHTHLARLSFTLRLGGRVVIADPGRLSYEMSDPLGPYGRSTAAHATVSVDGWNQSSADAQLLRAEFTSDSATLQGRYQAGYWKGRYGWSFAEGHGDGVWGEHERTLYWAKREYLIVLDCVTTDAGHAIHNSFPLGAGKWTLDSSGFRCTSAEGFSVHFVAPPNGAAVDCVEGRRQPPRGWLSQRDQAPLPAPHLEFRYPSAANHPVVSVIVIAPSGYQAHADPAHPNEVVIAKPDGKVDRITWGPDRVPRRN